MTDARAMALFAAPDYALHFGGGAGNSENWLWACNPQPGDIPECHYPGLSARRTDRRPLSTWTASTCALRVDLSLWEWPARQGRLTLPTLRPERPATGAYNRNHKGGPTRDGQGPGDINLPTRLIMPGAKEPVDDGDLYYSLQSFALRLTRWSAFYSSIWRF